MVFDIDPVVAAAEAAVKASAVKDEAGAPAWWLWKNQKALVVEIVRRLPADLTVTRGRAAWVDEPGRPHVHVLGLREPGYVMVVLGNGAWAVYRVLKHNPIAEDGTGGNDYVLLDLGEARVPIE